MSEELAQIRMRSGRERSGTVSPVAAVVTIGVFDGVHRGHRCVIEHTVERARAAGLEAAVVTFDPNPLEILRPRQAPARLCSVARRIELIEDLGVDRVLVLPFTADLSHETAEEFIDTTLRRSLDARTIVVGHGFRFGHKAAGTTETLRAAGLEVVEYNLVGDGQPVSSTRIVTHALASSSSSLTVSVPPSGICTSASASGSTNATVRVVCSSGQFVSIEAAPGQPFAGTHGAAHRFNFGPGLPLPAMAAAFGMNIGAGTVTALRILNVNGLDAPLEMLVSF